jgi:solute:Na+ symporter, SSS family
VTHPLDITVVVLYAGALLLMTLLIRRVKSVEDFSVASRELPSPVVFATLAATYIGPGYSIGLADKAAGMGYIWFWIFSAFCLQTLLIGRYVAPRLQSFRSVRTVGGVLGERYGRLTQMFSGLLTIAVLVGFAGVMAKASGTLISELTGMPFVLAAALSTAVVIAYSTFGGLKADVMNDVVQFIVLSIGLPLLLVCSMYYNGLSSLEVGVATLPSVTEAMPLTAVIALFASFFLGEMLIPPYTVRALASRTPGDARRGFTLAAVFGFAWFLVCASIGVVHASHSMSTSGVVLDAMGAYLPPGLYGLVLVALVAIILSSWDSLLNCASSALQADVIDVYRPSAAGREPSVVAAQSLNVVVGIGATYFAVNTPSLVDALLLCYSIWAPTIVLPLILAAFRLRVHPLSGLLGILCGGVSAGVWEWCLDLPAGVPAIFVGLLANQLGFWGTHAIMRDRPAPLWLGYAPHNV